MLVISRRVAPRLSDLSQEEVSDLFCSAQAIGRVIEKVYGGESLTFALQVCSTESLAGHFSYGRSKDGASAGQTVPHVHVHIIPRKAGDWLHNDDIYRDVGLFHAILARANVGGRSIVPKRFLDSQLRLPRTPEQMATEAASLVKYFPDRQM